MAGEKELQDDVTVSLEQTPSKRKKRPPAQLRVVHPKDLAVTIPLARPSVVLGRKPDEPSTPSLNHKTVSRKHFVVEWSSAREHHLGRDLSSRNGSWVNGLAASADPVPLAAGTIVRLGDVLAVYESGAGLTAAEVPAVSREALPGECAAIRQLRASVARAAADPSPALIIGETGTGKELIAAELHRLSRRKGKFVPVNAAALSSQLVESQLFGHVKGAFTGATTDSDGMFRAANGGTLFLDEIGEMPIDLQPKLLRAIQEGEVSPVGSTKTIKVDVRIVAATNRELADAVEAGTFRRDLFARLTLWQLRAPPLRRRRTDLFTWIGVLFEQWLRERGAKASPLSFDANAAEALLLQRWPENLRGLNRLVHELASHAPTEPISFDGLPEWLTDRPAAGSPPAKGRVSAPAATGKKRPAPDKEELLGVLEQNEWSVRATAKHFGRERKQIYRWMDKAGISRDGGKD